MKKLLISLGVLFLISGCNNNTKTLSCKMDNTINGLISATEYKIDYIDDKVKLVTITYDYTENNTTTTDTTNSNERTITTPDDNQIDGTDADTDGITDNKDEDNSTSNIDSDEIIDGAVGDTIDEIISGVTDTILDIAGIKNAYENRLSAYDNIEGLSYNVDIDKDNQYKVTYKIDLDKISDTDLANLNFNIDRSLETTISNYEGSGYTCK